MALDFNVGKKSIEIVAKVAHARHCANFIKKDEIFVFDLEGRLLPSKSTANLCLGMLARIQPALMIAKERFEAGLDPLPVTVPYLDCFDTGIDFGGMGKVTVELSLRDVS
ncbi:hypothetical protein N9D07_02455 [Alphaproteobacteria bacterium]|nr:hypothetical protein [Alphaproteobacteria bacterium]|tara:strand:- start:203 stop:532 length:330 start_codon:yes stop_codon:yes gene_type:complete